MSKAQRVVLVVLAAAVIVGSLLLFTPEDDDDSQTPATQASEPVERGKTATARPTPPRPEPATIEVHGDEPVGALETIRVEKGETVRIAVSSDTRQEVHVHGYDLLKNVAPGKPARFTFKAGIEGAFEVELEGPHTQIAKLEVRPG